MLLDDIKSYVAAIPAESKEKNGLYSFEFTVAERKAFLASQKLSYRGVFRIDEAKKELRFSELLRETGSGISGGDQGPGFGFKTETYKTGVGPRQGGIAEQSSLFGKRYSYSFDYSKIRSDIEALAEKAGYAFKYHVTPAGM